MAHCITGLIIHLTNVTKPTWYMKKINAKDGIEHFKVKVVTTRNDPRLNCHQRLQLQGSLTITLV